MSDLVEMVDRLWAEKLALAAERDAAVARAEALTVAGDGLARTLRNLGALTGPEKAAVAVWDALVAESQRCFWCSCPLDRCNSYRPDRKCCPDCRHDALVAERDQP